MTGKWSTIFLQLDSPKQMALNFKAFIPMQQTLDRGCMMSSLYLFPHLNSNKQKMYVKFWSYLEDFTIVT